MIIHSGQVRVFGDPLFLKETYGRGYQMHLAVHRRNAPETADIISGILPNAEVVIGFSGETDVDAISPLHETDITAVKVAVEEDHLVILNVNVPRGDLRGFPRLFSWLEGSKKAALLVKEWGISNTTLEEVFLQLCMQNKEINYTGNATNSERSAYRTCPMCRTRQRDNLVCLRSPNGHLMAVPDSLCSECAAGNDHFYIDNDVAESLDLIPRSSKEMGAINTSELARRRADLLASAYASYELDATQKLLAIESSDGRHTKELDMSAFDEERQKVDMEESSYEMLDSSSTLGEHPVCSSKVFSVTPLQMSIEPNATLPEHLGQFEGDNVEFMKVRSERSRGAEYYGSASAQIHAIVIKNIKMQYRQRCSNICSIIFVGVLFIMLYIMALLFSGDSLEQCSQGYLTDIDCSTSTLVDHIFSADDGSMSDDWATDDNDLGPNGYNIQYYLAPSSCGQNILTFQSSNYVSSVPGLPCTNNRLPVLWSSLLNSTDLLSAVSSTGLYLNARYPPSGALGDSDSANNFLYNNQIGVYADTLQNTYPSCSEYAPSTLSGTFLTPLSDAQQDFSDYFAEGIFVCEECTSYVPGKPRPPLSIFYDGSMWIADVPGKYSYCTEQECAQYPYGFMNYKSSSTDQNYEYLGSTCPSGIQSFELSADSYSAEKTIVSMTWLNLLSNLIADPDLEDYPIQVGISKYGSLDFDSEGVSQSEGNILTVIGILLMNGFWPTAVWRSAVETSQDIVLMMRTVGMRPESYIIGMFGFDMFISVTSGVAMVGFAVGLRLSQFDGAPVGYLVAIVILSAWALNSGILLIVRLLGKHSSVLPLIAPCVLIAATAGVSLTNILVYPNEGDYPLPLCLIPFFAQV